jgi:fumarate hydratase class II
MKVPADALYGAQTARAVENFPISSWPMPSAFIAAMGLIKEGAAKAHRQAGRLDARRAEAIVAAAREVATGRWNDQFVVDVFQTGSGTSTNMNANEVIANRANQILGGSAGDKTLVHPNDHVNMGQSSNDVIPTALNVSAAVAMHQDLAPALRALHGTLIARAAEFDALVKIGRTHLMDAVPIRLGQEFSGYAAAVDNCTGRLLVAISALCDLAIGGTAVGTGLNAPNDLAAEVCRFLSEHTHLPFREAVNHFQAQTTLDAAVFASGVLKGTALVMGKIASDIRLLASGPRCGLGELVLPATQPGSSIMPGKVNPVMCESVVQVACQVVGCDATITAAATGGVGGILDLNVAMPVIASNLHTAINLLTNVAKVFDAKCLRGLAANTARCGELVEQSLAMVTVLAPRLGYDAAAALAKEASATGKTIRQLLAERNILPKDELDKLLDARTQTGA